MITITTNKKLMLMTMMKIVRMIVPLTVKIRQETIK